VKRPNWPDLFDEILKLEKEFPDARSRAVAEWRAWQQRWRARLDACAADYAATGEWIVLTDEMKQAIAPRILWARHLTFLFCQGEKGKPFLPCPRSREKILRWLLIQTWNECGLEYYAFSLR
jgi:hypothetical protein